MEKFYELGRALQCLIIGAWRCIWLLHHEIFQVSVASLHTKGERVRLGLGALFLLAYIFEGMQRKRGQNSMIAGLWSTSAICWIDDMNGLWFVGSFT